MYATEYFVRFVDSENQAQHDLEIGHSFYAGDENEPLDGLCGFGPFETVEEAQVRAEEGFGMYPMAAIFTGRYVAADPDGAGDLFRPISLISTLPVGSRAAA